MSAIAFLIEQIAIGLYILIGVALIVYFRRWLQGKQAMRSSYFELERDFARQQQSSALFMMFILLEIGLFVVAVQNIVAPTMREDQEVLQAIASANPAQRIIAGGDGIFATSTPPAVIEPPSIDDSGIELGIDTSGVIFITPTPTFTPVGTILPDAPPTVGCESPYATLQIPANGMRVFQITPVRGVAYHEDFSEFRLELAGPTTVGQYGMLFSNTTPAEELSTLYQFNPNDYDPGMYKFRLVVFNLNKDIVASCEVTIEISDPIPTLTPIPTATPRPGG